jgi:hypothetical protein
MNLAENRWGGFDTQYNIFGRVGTARLIESTIVG